MINYSPLYQADKIKFKPIFSKNVCVPKFTREVCHRRCATQLTSDTKDIRKKNDTYPNTSLKDCEMVTDLIPNTPKPCINITQLLNIHQLFWYGNRRVSHILNRFLLQCYSNSMFKSIFSSKSKRFLLCTYTVQIFLTHRCNEIELHRISEQYPGYTGWNILSNRHVLNTIPLSGFTNVAYCNKNQWQICLDTLKIWCICLNSSRPCDAYMRQ